METYKVEILTKKKKVEDFFRRKEEKMWLLESEILSKCILQIKERNQNVLFY